jgi:ribosomal protein S27E
VLERDDGYIKEHKLKSPRVYWKCRCDCGAIKTVAGTALRNGDVKSCGKGLCYPTAKDLTGKQFGELTVIELVS